MGELPAYRPHQTVVEPVTTGTISTAVWAPGAPASTLVTLSNQQPQITAQYPPQNSAVSTLTPELIAAGTDDGQPNPTLQFMFALYNSAGDRIALSPVLSVGAWQVPAGTLAWGQSYAWIVQAFDGALWSASPPVYYFSVQVPQPPVTSRLSQNTGGHGFEPNIGNYTMSATDAQVLTVGPALVVRRDYNSADPRLSGAFGAGWSSVLDAKATEQKDAAGNLQTVVVTYPDGQDVAFGSNSNGSFSPPSGRFATFATVTTGGYSLTDKNATVYKFTQAAGTGVYAITSITDASNRALTFGYTGGRVTTVSSAASNRALHVSWFTPAGASAAHVQTAATDPAVVGDASTAQTWTYSYSGDLLSRVCPPTSATACATYSYTSSSQYPAVVADLGPRSYWRLGESSGATAASSVLANEGSDNGTYANVSYGQPGPLPGSAGTAVGFNGTSSNVLLQPGVVSNASYQTVSLWFKTTTVNGVLFSYQADPIGNGTTPGNYVPALYIGTSGKLYGKFWTQVWSPPVVTAGAVTDGRWHHVVLAGGGNTQAMYLDGALVGTGSGTIALYSSNGAQRAYVGAGFIGGGWPDEPHQSSSSNTGYAEYFTGSISDVAFYDRSLSASNVTALYGAGHAATKVLSTVTRPSGNPSAQIGYDALTGRVAQLTDANGGVWTVGAPSVSGSSQVYASTVLGAGPVDYWRFNDSSGPTAVNQVHGGTATYNTVTLGTAGRFADATAAKLTGPSSYVRAPDNLVNGTGNQSIGMWFNTTGHDAVLFGYAADPISNGTTSGGYVPALYIGTSGKLHGEFWGPSGVSLMSSASPVNDGKWHYVVLSGGVNTQSLYLDGTAIGSSGGGMAAGGMSYDSIGVGFVGGAWADQLNYGQPAVPAYLVGSITDVAFYNRQLTAAQVAQQYAAAQASTGLTPVQTVTVTDPGSKQLRYDYDATMGNRLIASTNGLGYTTRYGYDTGGFLNTVTDPIGNVITTGHDVRGNVVSHTTCQNQVTNSCSTTYYTYYPNDTSATLSPDPRNDAVLTVRDARSSSATDSTYLTTYTYDAKGNQTAVTTPPVPGFPSGRSRITSYTDGTTVAAADGGFAPAGLPWKVTSPGGAVSTTTYFHNGDVAQVTNPAGLVTRYSYDNLGRVTTETLVSDSNPAGLVTTYSIDGLNRVRVQTNPAVTNRVTGAVHTARGTTLYDDDGNQTSVTVADLTGGDAARTTSATFNSHNQQASATDAAGNTTTFGYDAYGHRTTVVDPAGTETDQAFDADGHLLTTTLKAYTGDPANPSPPTDLVRESRAYDPAGRLASVTDSMGWVTSYAYTDNGLTATIIRSDPAHPGTSFRRESNSYDPAGNLVTHVTNNGTTTVTSTVDAASRINSTLLDPNGLKRTTAFTYSPDDAVLSTTVSDPDGASVTDATYDPMGRPTSKTVHDTSLTPVGRWRLADGSGTTAVDTYGNQPGALSRGIGWSSNRGGSATFDGTGAITTTGPVIDTTTSFTVTAWVKPSSNSDFRVAVAQRGTQQDGFVLAYAPDVNRWQFARWSTDTATPTTRYTANSVGTPVLNAWTHLAGVFEASTGRMTLYVNGVAANSTTDPTPFRASGPLVIGQGMAGGNPCCGWLGEMSDVQVYQQPLTAAQVSAVFGGTLPAAGSVRLTTTWRRDQLGLPTTSTDANGNTTLYSYDEAGRLAVTTGPTVNTETGGGAPVATRPVAMVGYDTFGETTETSDPNGNVVTTGYDSGGRPVSTTLPSYTPPGSGTPITAVATRTYNSLGQLATATDPLLHKTTYAYDQLSNVATVTAPNNGVTHYTYDTESDQLSVTDANGALSQATYDYLGRRRTTTQVVRQPAPAAYTTTYAYDTPGGLLSSATSPGSVVTGYGYDNAGETTSVTDGASNTTRYGYDYAGRRIRTTLPDGSGATVTFNAAGRQVGAAKLDTDGTTVLASVSARFDNNGNRTAVTDARGHTITFAYDATDRLTSEVQPVTSSTSITTSFGYDAAGNRTRFTDGRDNAFVTTYTPWNLPEAAIEPVTPAYPAAADRTFTTVYDAAGQVATQTSPGGVSITNTYNDIGNLIGQSGTGAEASTVDRVFGYDTGGRLKSASAPGGTDTFTLDDRSLLLSATGPSGASSFTYNGDGQMASRGDAAGTTGYTYDTAGRLKTITDPATTTVLGFGYNTLSQLAQVTYGAGGNVRTFGYNHLHQLTSDTFKTSTNTTIAWIGYGNDLNGNINWKTVNGFAGGADNTYTYDYADRLSTWTTGGTTTTYGYDNSGNRTQAGSQAFSYNARNQLQTGAGSTYTYTARGTLASVTTGSTVVPTTNDAFGQTVTQGGQTYTYDALGRVLTDATEGAGTRTFTYTGVGNTVAGDGTATYSRDPAGAVVGINTGTSSVLAWTDRHTDVVANFTATGTALTGSTTYDPLGKVLATANAAGNLGYQSGWTETASGRVNMAARWYNTATGQFDNRDTTGNNPVPNSAAANRYAYANANPLTNIDPDGHRAVDFDDYGRVYFSAPSTNGGPDRTWGRPRFKPRITQKAPSSGPDPGCGHYRYCYEQHKNDVRDLHDQMRQQVDQALDRCHDNPRCLLKVEAQIKNGDYNWVSNGSGTYETTDGHTIYSFTDEFEAAAAAGYRISAQAAEDAARAKAAACRKDFWCHAKQWAQDHAQLIGAVAGAVVGVIVGAACTAGSWGVGALGCAVIAGAIGGAVSGAVTHGLDVSAGRADGGWKGWATSVGGGALIGGIGGAVGFGMGALATNALGAAAKAAAGNLFQRAAVGAVSGAASGAVTGGVTAAAGYGFGCLTGAGCTAKGLASSVMSGAASGAVFGGIGGAIGGVKGGGCKNSFAPATPILMADGTTRQIKDVKVGDKVTATDPTTGTTMAEPVTQLHLNLDTELTDLTLSATPEPATKDAGLRSAGGIRGPTTTLHTTAHHPFWDATDQRWANAGSLAPGHKLVGPRGQTQYVLRVHNFTGAKDMRNLTVALLHTYYVIAGTVPVLVHNCGVETHPAKCTCAGPVEVGQTVYRVWGQGAEGGARPWGRYWSRVDPRTVENYRDEAGLPDVNPARFLSIGRLRGTGGVEVTPGGAAPLDGNVGGIDEIKVPWPTLQIRVQQVIGLNPEL